jgi:hypothetical protein
MLIAQLRAGDEAHGTCLTSLSQTDPEKANGNSAILFPIVAGFFGLPMA